MRNCKTDSYAVIPALRRDLEPQHKRPEIPAFAGMTSAFTLIELAIVLVVIGLILGGVAVGRNLIRSAQLKTVLSEQARYVQALNNFRDKYHALPGDFNGATALWGTTGGANTAGTGTQTFDGDGNGRITTQGSSGTYYEQFRAWQQLANASLIGGSYSGVTSSAGTQNRIPGSNVPASQLSGAGWGLITLFTSDANMSDLPTYVAGDTIPGTVLWLGGASISPYTNNQMAPVLTAAEALSIDQKIDNGLATSGAIEAQNNASGTACYAGTAYSTATGGTICDLVFKTGF